MSEYIEIGLRWIFGFQMLFWGLNGFFHWVPIPPSPKVIDDFVAACMQTRFILPTVKIIEIVFGAFLLFNFIVPVSLLVFAPIMFVVSGLHLLHNPKWAAVLIPLSLPYLVLLVVHSGSLLRLVH
ncbi:hypothetical protein QJS83_01725 [Bdellovibrio sp. 22V]|uniref:hypothetical protein n=1 Tax=Bdellovibrio sp. 22V TaxID=3044166 RepID=UPI002542F8BE|nr:hypothetical protein [Bdellovibrio sp. 22V]WII72588.1 hypothetical protein QJS83_01725 [Bdellovibrio sp. 22V]